MPSLLYGDGITLTPDPKAVYRTTGTWTASQNYSSATFNGHLFIKNPYGLTVGTMMVVQQGLGNVGIGTILPIGKLTVAQDVPVSNDLAQGQIMAVGATDPTKRLVLGYDTTNNLGYIQAGQSAVGFKTLALNPNDGNVGIGTTAPDQKLDVNGNIRTESGTLLLQRNLVDLAGRRNWTFQTETNVTGDLALQESASNTGINGTTRLEILSGGNVGIGTTDPQQKLDVVGLINTQGAAGGIQITKRGGSGAGIPVIYNPTGDDLRFYIGGDLMTIQNGGNVGIGTTIPSAKLSINERTGGQATYTGNLKIDDGAVNGPGVVGGIEILNGISGNGYGYKIYTNNSNDYLGIATRYNSATWTERLAISQINGNVGIGTTGPQGKLHVLGDDNVAIFDTSGAANTTKTLIDFRRSNSSKWGINLIATTNDLQLYDYSGTPGTRVTFQNGGNVGIGTANPSSRLEVKQGSVTVQFGVSAASYTVNGIPVISSTWSVLAYAGFITKVTSGTIAANTTLTINASDLGFSAIGIPMCGEMEGVNTAANSVRLKDTLTATSMQVFNADVINIKKFTCHVPGKL